MSCDDRAATVAL